MLSFSTYMPRFDNNPSAALKIIPAAPNKLTLAQNSRRLPAIFVNVA
jgi:hypothetical protein